MRMRSTAEKGALEAGNSIGIEYKNDNGLTTEADGDVYDDVYDDVYADNYDEYYDDD